MCGIVGYVGTKDSAPILVEGLRRLEYRGYDSAGLAVHTGRGVEIVRAVGKLANLDSALKKNPLSGTTGIGHTRWATHGRPSEANAHPHVAGRIAVVHNGIIENHVQLRRDLEAKGVRFQSDTDTEIVAHLIEEAMQRGLTRLSEAVRAALGQVRGAYAIAVVNGDAPDEIVVAKHDSPLVLGIGDGENFAASDIPAILAHTRDVVLLQDGEIAVLARGGVEIMTLDGTPVNRAKKRIDWSPTQAEKGGYKHFMLKEIHEQPRAIEDTLRGRVDLNNADVVAAEIGMTDEVAKNLGRVYFVACGTSAHAAMAGRYWVEQLARVPSTLEIGSEVRYRDPVFMPNDLVVAVSQSGETLDTLAAVKAAKAAGAHIISVANVVDSAIPRVSDGVLYTHAGPEIGVASTKCFTTQLAALLMLAVYLGRRRGTLKPEDARRVLDALWHVPAQMREVLAKAEDVKNIAKKHLRAHDMLFLGRGTQFPVALEGALKLKEISYIHAEGYAAGEMKHGPIALIDEDMPVVVVCPRDNQYEKTLSNMQEVKAREGQVIGICTENDADVKRLCTGNAGGTPRSGRGNWAADAPDAIEIPVAENEVLPLLTVVPLQLLAYYMADLKGTDVDQPRNLAKTVTVE
ncbi:Glucosamine-fructose-6-phosphate aminotransferase, isomerising [Labilithrix luteola]|uniref:Glutamine--fructose-6-phosphate aminotransferase [isomerizing] n=1 Tax=Labilithrix luteola TaxID=1391654 RepID=A0A0K1PVP8_9BACT|nr:glutamine--fructose-6-phosphate transaminase (isomerizing) [Labilithrix luteola]AKU97605.1 Glucosamine-fructose-6-phosphate aminotransferase, isomerising [Labilithrix luteola]